MLYYKDDAPTELRRREQSRALWRRSESPDGVDQPGFGTAFCATR